MEVKRVFDFVYKQAETNPLNDCLNAKEKGSWRNYSTKEVLELSSKIGMGLLKMGIAPGDKVAIISTNRPEWVIADLGIQQIGATGVPMYPTISADDYLYIFQDADVKIVFVESEEMYRKVKAARKDHPLMAVFSFNRFTDEGIQHWEDVLKAGENGDKARFESLREAVKPEDLLTLIYTSGTTGRPKGVMLTHNNIVSNSWGVYPILNFPDGKAKALSFLPLCHIFERTATCVYFMKGVSIYYAESMEKIADNLKEVQPDCFTTVPRLLEKIYDKILGVGENLTGWKKNLFLWAVDMAENYNPNEYGGIINEFKMTVADKLVFSKWRAALGGNVKLIISGAAALQPRLSRVFWAAGMKVVEGYGLTETSPVISASIPTHENIRIGCVGPPIKGVEVRIAEDGEILCKGPNVMVGYYNKPDQTAEVLKDGWFHTGDIGTLIEGKYLKITDRKKEMFKTSGGKYIAPQVLENKFKESLFIEQLMVFGDGQKFPAAIIAPSFDFLKDWCKKEGIAYNSDDEAVKNPKVLAKIQEEVNRYNEGFGQWEMIKKFVLVVQPFSIDGGELTPTLKLKRKVIAAKYEKEMNAVYA